MKKRKYTKSLRAEQQGQTRDRIVEAAMMLHEELGPAHTSIKAVAEKAGVQRLTVYRYFPDDVSLFQACTSHWLALNPPPDMNEWSELLDARERSQTALLSFYQYYRSTEAMWTVSYRDVDKVIALQEPMAQIEAYIDQVCDDLVKVWKKTKHSKKQLQVTLRHALRFSTWQSLKNAKLKDEKITELVESWLEGVIG